MRDAEQKVTRGFFWLGASGGVLRVLDLLGSIFILWLLDAEQVGIAALAWTVAMIVESFNGLGVGVALVQSPELDEEESDSLFWFSSALGLGLSVAIAVASPAIARAYGREAAWSMLAVASSRVAFVAAALVPVQLLQRRLEFKELAVVQTSAAAVAALVKIGLLLLGAGAWSLVISHVVEGAFTLVSVYALSPYWPKWRFSFGKSTRFLRFGAKAAASTILYQSYRNLDFVIVGKVFGVATLGAYRVASDVAMVPAQAVLDVVNRTAFPVYARIGLGHPETLKRMFLSMTRRLALVSGPLCVLSLLFAPSILALVSGARWDAAGPMIRLLCWAALLRSLTQSIPQLFHAAGRPELAAYDSSLTLIGFVASAYALVKLFGASLGANAVSLAWITTYALTLCALFLMTRWIVPLKIGEFAKSLLQPLLMMVVLGALLSPLKPVLDRALPQALSTGVGLGLGLATLFGFARFVLKVRLAPKSHSSSRRDGSSYPPAA
ncbi:MAG: lipopolysaccharide biosynthesis protein [Polyangiaceae bacterium]